MLALLCIFLHFEFKRRVKLAFGYFSALQGSYLNTFKLNRLYKVMVSIWKLSVVFVTYDQNVHYVASIRQVNKMQCLCVG